MGDATDDISPAEPRAAAALVCSACGASIADLSATGTCPQCSAANPSPRETLSNSVGRGASWIMLATALAKVGALVAQIFLGWMLTEVQFGVFASAAAMGWFVGILKDGGSNVILLQRGPDQYEKVAGPLFWMGATLSVLCGLVIVGIASWILIDSPDHSVTAWILLVIALAIPLQAIGAQLQTKLRQDLRFAKYSQIQLYSALLRQVSTVAFALMGFGAMSFAWPYVLCALYEAAASYRATNEAVWKRKPEFHLWGAFFRQGLWSLIGTGSNYCLDQGPYLILGAMVAKAITGQFYFAFQLTAQAGVLLGYAVQQALIPALVRLNDHATRQAEAALRALRVMSFMGAAVCVGLSVCIEPIEAILWRERWAPAVPAIVILGVFFSWRINFGLTTALLQAQGRFKRHALLTGFEGVGLMACTAIAALFPDATVTSISWWVGAWLLVGRLCVTLFVFRSMAIELSRVLGALMSSWLLAVASGVLVVGLDRELHFLLRLSALARDLLAATGRHDPSKWMVDMPAQGLRLILLGGSFSLVFLLVSRAFNRGHLSDTLDVAPARFRGLGARILRLPQVG